MNIFFLFLATCINLYTPWVYIPGILKGKIKPHAFSWLPWTILTSIAAIIQIKNGEDFWGYATLVLSSLICAYIFHLSLKYGEKNITKSDIISLVLCLVSILFWITTKDDIIALILICVIDALAFYPTWRKSWDKPFEESLDVYSLSCLKSVFSLFTLKHFIPTSYVYPLFLVLVNGLFALYLMWRRKVIKK